MPPRLKSLELHGYKTFASRTEFQFPGTITAIVGPNGSGKSNIADALRWVLGEQSYSLLRGRKTEDMIFAGSEQRSRAGMASATITFDNEDSWLPIDFSEVSITRRAYRDGNNEYLLNGQRVRLREISELLAQSGLAERTYTVIGQGLVDAALALKPEERRRLFEEAAGIGLYRSRREDALNRLEATKRNLERVQDILVELEPRLRSLERQAKRVQEYERLRTDLQNLLRDWYGFHWHKAQKEFTHAREVFQIQETRLKQAGDKYEEVNRQVIELRTQMGEIRSCLNEWHTQSAGLHRSKEQISREMAVIEERLRSLQEQKQGRIVDIARLEEEINALQDRVTSSENEKQRLQADLEEAQKQAKSTMDGLHQQQEKRSSIEKALRDLRSQLTTNETQLVKRKAHQDELSIRLDTLNRTYESGEKTIQSAKADLEKARLAQERANISRNEAETRRKQLNQDLHECHQVTLKLDSERKKLDDQATRFNGQRAKLQVQLDAIYQAEKTLSGMSEGARALLQSSRQGKNNSPYTALISALDIPKDYEVAISAALGEYINLLFVNASTSLEEAIDHLDNSSKGRAALLPLDWIESPSTQKVKHNGDCLGVAMDFIQAPESIRPGLSLLLGRTLIIRDRSVARKVLAESEGVAQVVTLKGEVFQRTGMVIAGRESPNSLLSRPREKREIQENIKRIDKELGELDGQLKSLSSQINSARNNEETLEKTIREAAVQYDHAVENAHNCHFAYEQAQRQVDWHTKQRATVENQIEITRQELTKGKNEDSSIEESIGKLREAIRESAMTVNRLPMDEFQGLVNHWNTQVAVISRALKDTATRLGELQHTLDGNHKRLDDFHSQISNFNLNQELLNQKHSDLNVRESALDVELAELRGKIEPSERDLHRIEKEYNRLEEVETAAQQALTVAERYQTQAQLEVTRHRETVENLRRRIEEDFGLVSLEYEENVAGPTPLPLEGMVEQLPLIPEVPQDLETNISRLRAQLRRLGPVNPEAQVEYQDVLERYQFMTGQVSDLHKADGDLRQIITELDELMRREFRRTFEAVAEEFKGMFTRLFSGGSARLILLEGDTPNDTGIEIETRLPGRREQGLSLLSGGERSLTAVALVFSLLKISPTPFCIMDEVDAMLDEANVGRFRDLLRELSRSTQFIVITHNRNTVQAADVIYGVTMGRDSTSQVISLKMDEVNSEMAE